MKINVTVNTDDKYIQHCMAMLCSLFENNKNHNILVHILSSKLTDLNKNHLSSLSEKYNQKCKFYDIDDSKLEGVQFRKTRPLSKAAYYRLLLSSILDKELTKVIYLDCDMIVLGDISELFELDISKYALAATIDNFPYTNQHRLQLNMDVDERTFCSGIMLVNLEYWRINNSEEELLKYARCYRKEIHLHDQDVLNYVFKNNWFLLPPKWNRVALSSKCKKIASLKSFDYYEYIYEPKIIHYASVGVKPWYKGLSPKKKLYSCYLIKSGYGPILYEEKGLYYRIKGVKSVLYLWISIHIEPFIPQLIKIFISDLVFIVNVLIIILLKRGNGLKLFLLKNNLKE